MTRSRIRQLGLLVVSVLAAAWPTAHAEEMQLEYLGHIEMPDIPWDPDVYEARRHFGFSRGVFCYLPERDSFLMIGHPYRQLFAEISNPGPGGQAELLHDFIDVTQGSLARQSEKYGEVRLQSLLYDSGRVLVSAEKWYNVSNVAVETHGSFQPDPDDLRFEGWWRISGHLGQTTGYYMTRLPEHCVSDGRWLLTGASLTWRTRSSPGPCAILVNPDQARPGDALQPVELLRYRVGRQPFSIDYGDLRYRGRPAWSGGVDGWMGGCRVGGVVAVADRLIYFGRQGKGFDFYGTGEEYRNLTGLPEPDDSKGYRCGPYEAAMWIYSIEALHRGDRSVIRMPFPWSLAERGDHDLRNACRHGNRIYVAEASAKWSGEQALPVIHVLEVRGVPSEPDQVLAD